MALSRPFAVFPKPWGFAQMSHRFFKDNISPRRKREDLELAETLHLLFVQGIRGQKTDAQNKKIKITVYFFVLLCNLQ